MNAQIADIRRRVAEGYNMAHRGQPIDDIQVLLRKVDELVQFHRNCVNTEDCVADIAEELGVARPSQT